MVQYLIRNSTVVTGNLNRLILYKSAIFIQNGIIQDIGESDLLEAKYHSVATVEGVGKVVRSDSHNGALCSAGNRASCSPEDKFSLKLNGPWFEGGVLNTSD